MTTRKDHFSYLVALGNCPGWLGEFELRQFRTYLFLPLFAHASKREYNAVSAERSMKFGNTVRAESSRYLTKIMTLRRKVERKQRRSLRLLYTANGDPTKLNV